ncbi:MAG: hypothetical protein EHM18_04215 [Acidobacteria bacterium]|nr:MAG: hypothetical protein EHM18_04215 [Acidobacteriota bacterium]
MKKLTVLVLVALLMTPLLSENTYGYAVRDTAQQLTDVARDLSEVAYNGFARRDRGNRADVEALYVVMQFRASADLFRRMIEDNRPTSELRDSLSVLRNELQRMEQYAFGRNERRRMFDLVQSAEAELGGRPGGRAPGGYYGEYGTSGRMRWSGKVDDEIVIMIRGSRASIRTVTGDQVRDDDYSFDSPLPRQELRMNLKKVSGRGSVDLLEEPSRRNDYSAVVRIRDKKSGTDDYAFELRWE